MLRFPQPSTEPKPKPQRVSKTREELSVGQKLELKNPRAQKNKIGTSAPFEKKKKNTNKQKTRPPPKTRNFMGMGVFQQKNQKMPGAHKIDAAVSGPRIAGRNFTDIIT